MDLLRNSGSFQRQFQTIYVSFSTIPFIVQQFHTQKHHFVEMERSKMKPKFQKKTVKSKPRGCITVHPRRLPLIFLS